MKLRRIAVAVAGAALAVVSLAAPAGASQQSLGGSASTTIIGGSTATSFPYGARLFADGAAKCTATVIASQYVITAKHCVTSTTARYQFRIGSLDATTGGTVVNATTVTRHPSADLAIVKIDRTVSGPYAPLGGGVSVGQTVQVYGWGATCTNQPETSCQSQKLKVANVRVVSTTGRDNYGGVGIQATKVDGITAGGDSGGPMMASGRQVGVASTSDRSSTTIYTNLNTYRSWITSVAGV